MQTESQEYNNLRVLGGLCITGLNNYFNMLIKIEIIIKTDTKISVPRCDTAGQ